MKRSLTLILSFIFSCINIYAQNLVPNSSFEIYSQCPTGPSQVEQCTNWIQPSNATPDYFNSCGAINLQVPNNFLGYQNAKTGNAYMGISSWGLGNAFHEYIEVELTNPLTAGNCYYFEMYVNLGDISIYTAYDLGVYVSDTLVDSVQTYKQLPFTPQIENTVATPFDTLNWTLVSGNYTAHGGEQFLIIGNFYADSLVHSTLINPSPFGLAGTYLLIDDVSLTVCVGLEEFNKLDINIAPNPFTDKLTITANSNELYELMLTDVTGRQVLKQSLQGNSSVQTGSLGKGIYFATVRKKEKVVTVKMVKK